MRAAVLYETGKLLQVKDLMQDPPRAGEVRLKIEAAGICGSDHHAMTGRLPMPLPVVLGHEGAGVIAEVGPGVTRVKPGDRCILAFIAACGHCRHCRSGNGQLCDTHAKTRNRLYDGTARWHDEAGYDIDQMGKLGLFAEQVVVQQEACYPLSDELPMEVAALIGCCVTTGVGAVINSPAARAGMTVAVFGCGGVGLNVIQGARLLNASRIIAVDVHDHKLEFSRSFGATDTVNSRGGPPSEAIREIASEGVDMAFDAYGSADTIGAAFDSTRKGGTTVLIGAAPPGETPSISLSEMAMRQKSVVGSLYGSATPHKTFATVVALYLKGRLDIEGQITRRYSLDRINEGLRAVEEGENGRGVVAF